MHRLVLAFLAAAGLAAGGGATYLPVPGSAWRLALADFDGTGARSLAFGT